MYLPKPYKGDFKITSEYDPARKHPVTGEIKPHNGVDIGMPTGTTLFAPIDGKVTIYNQTTKDGKLTGYGHYMALIGKTSQGTEVFFLFAHLSERLFESGMFVKAGTPIAKSGNSGTSTGDHLHLSVSIFNKQKNDFVFENPRKYIDFDTDENLKGKTFFS